jgi:NADH:ubiquinone oxidoreductase subunit 6 (subunit J)
MSIAQILFDVMALIALASALFVAASANLVRSVFMFFVTLFALAGLYVLALADFVAITQIVIYVGGILVLIIFAFMLSGKETLEVVKSTDNRILKISSIPAFLLSALLMIMLVNVLIKSGADNLGWIKEAKQTHNVITVENEAVGNIGVNIMTHYLLPFEVISILLLMALVGAAHLSRKESQA